MTTARRASSPRTAARRRRLRIPPKRWLRSLTRKARRAIRRRFRKTVRDAQRRYRRWRMHRQRRRLEVKRAAAAQPLAVRSITGRPRPATTAAPSATAPMAQRVKRDKGGRFNGSTGAGKTVSTKKTAAKKVAVPAAQRDLARGDATLRRVEGRLARTERRIDKL